MLCCRDSKYRCACTHMHCVCMRTCVRVCMHVGMLGKILADGLAQSCRQQVAPKVFMEGIVPLVLCRVEGPVEAGLRK